MPCWLDHENAAIANANRSQQDGRSQARCQRPSGFFFDLNFLWLGGQFGQSFFADPSAEVAKGFLVFPVGFARIRGSRDESGARGTEHFIET